MKPEWLQELIALVSRHYNKPPAQTPREAMWERIRLARDYNRQPMAEIPRERMWERAMRFRASSALPALAQRGIVRVATFGQTTTQSGWVRNRWIIAPASLLSATLAVTVAHLAPQSGDITRSGAAVSEVSTLSAAPGGALTSESESTTRDMLNYSVFLSSSSDRWYLASDDDPVTEAYKRAATSHLQQSAILLGGYATMSSDSLFDRRTLTRVRSLLSTTRLLLNSQAAVKMQYRMVLQDLEFVLVKMTLIGPATVEADREQIGQTIERRRLLARMRDLLPTNVGASAN